MVPLFSLLFHLVLFKIILEESNLSYMYLEMALKTFCCGSFMKLYVLLYILLKNIFLWFQLFTEYGKLAMESNDVKPFQVNIIIIISRLYGKGFCHIPSTPEYSLKIYFGISIFFFFFPFPFHFISIAFLSFFFILFFFFPFHFFLYFSFLFLRGLEIIILYFPVSL